MRRQFLKDRSGSVAVMTALLLPLFGGAALFAVDHLRASQQIAAMQKAADAAALASARQLAFVLLDEETARGRSDSSKGGEVDSRTLSAIAGNLVKTAVGEDFPDVVTKATLLEEDRVRVAVSARYGSLFGEMGAFGENPFTVRSTAQSFGGQNTCLIALGNDDDISVEMDDNARVDGNNCGLYSGSTSGKSVSVKGGARMNVSFVCSAGGYEGGAGNFLKEPNVDCQQIGNPLEARGAPPTGGGCSENDLELEGGTHTLDPGIYCGGVEIEEGADVWLNEGIYVFKDGELEVKDNSKLAGTGVGLYFDDKDSYFKILDQSEIDLAAPVAGPMAGIVIATRPLCGGGAPCESGRKFEIKSSNVRSLLGTISLPTDELLVDTTMPVSSEAAFTIVVVGRMELKQSPTLTLNTDYEATNVPVPNGFAGVGTSAPRLVD